MDANGKLFKKKQINQATTAIDFYCDDRWLLVSFPVPLDSKIISKKGENFTTFFCVFFFKSWDFESKPLPQPC